MQLFTHCVSVWFRIVSRTTSWVPETIFSLKETPNNKICHMVYTKYLARALENNLMNDVFSSNVD